MPKVGDSWLLVLFTEGKGEVVAGDFFAPFPGPAANSLIASIATIPLSLKCK